MLCVILYKGSWVLDILLHPGNNSIQPKSEVASCNQRAPRIGGIHPETARKQRHASGLHHEVPIPCFRCSDATQIAKKLIPGEQFKFFIAELKKTAKIIFERCSPQKYKFRGFLQFALYLTCHPFSPIFTCFCHTFLVVDGYWIMMMMGNHQTCGTPGPGVMEPY